MKALRGNCLVCLRLRKEASGAERVREREVGEEARELTSWGPCRSCEPLEVIARIWLLL